MHPTIKFWGGYENWPPDKKGYVFLARAVHEVGTFLFDEQWTGQEPLTPAKIKNEQGTDIETPEHTRLHQVASQIVLWCRTNSLQIGLMPIGGGAIIGPQSLSVWQWDHAWPGYFRQCQMDPTRPFGLSSRGNRYIFVTRKSLNECIGFSTSAIRLPKPPILPVTAGEGAKNKRSRRHNEVKGDELQEQLRKLKMVAEKETKFPVPEGNMTSVARTVHKLGAKIGVKLKPGTIRQIFGNRYPPANRLVEERDIEAWWRGSSK